MEKFKREGSLEMRVLTKNCGGMVYNSEEVSIMEMEQRDCARQVLDINQLEKERVNDENTA